MPLLKTLIPPLLLLTAAAHADPQRPVAERAVDIYTPVSADEQRLAGLFAVRTRANIEGYLEQIDIAAILQPFRSHSGNVTVPETAETAGLFLMAASNSYEYSDDAQLRSVMDKVAAGVEKAQDPDGYLGLYSKENRWSQNGILTETSSLLGLIAYWHVTGDDTAAESLERATGLLLKEFSGKQNLPQSTSVLAPVMVEMYRMTGNPRYLQFCRSITSLNETQSGASNLVSALTGYGLVELYRVTGADADLTAAKKIWQRLLDSGDFLAGIPASGGHLDSCLTLAWFQFTLDLFRLTGELHYASTLEPLIYNAISAAQNVHTGAIDPAVPLTGNKTFARGLDVCSAAESVALSEIGEAVWGRYQSGLAVLSYNPGHASVRLRRRATIQVYTESSYPQSGSVLLHVEPSHPMHFPVQLLVPAWTREFKAKVGGSELTGKPGQFLTINREWRRGDTVTISIQMTATTVTDPRDHSRIAIRRGPEFLTPVGTADHTPPRASAATLDAASLTELSSDTAGLPTPMQPPRYAVHARADGRDYNLVLAPLASASSADLWFQNR